MKLAEYIEGKKTELIWSGLYRDVELASLEEVGLYKNCMVSAFFSKQGDLDRDVQEVNLHELTEDSSITKTNDNGVCVGFNVVLKGKRKPIKKKFYALYV